MPPLSQTLPVFVKKLGWKRAFPDPGGVRFDNAQHKVDRTRPDPDTGRGLPRNHIRGCDKRVGAKIDV